jgi:potassium efflux system protein
MLYRHLARGAIVCLGLALCCPLVAQYQPLELLNPPAATPPAPQALPEAPDGPMLAAPAAPPTLAAAPLPTPAAPAAAATPAGEPAPAVEPPVQFVGLDSVKYELGQSWSEIWQSFLRVWNLVLFEVGAEKPPIRVSTLTGGLVLLGFGYIAAGMISRWLAGKLLTRFGMKKSEIAPVQSIAYYALLATFTVLSLNVLSVPLTALSFFGGVLAIGVGFGSQNIVNNFISGLILLAERPIRVGDVIQIDTWTGTVMQIGARSTKIATAMNHEVIVPNSKLLETNVVNWTLSDDTVCSIISVGCAYGSPAREVQRLLTLAATEHEDVLKDPLPEVLFTDFAADAMTFQLRFWVNLRTSKKGEVESDLRFRIDELLADRGIVIAYPQRDVHLNVLRPVEVRLAQPMLSSPPFGQSKGAAA